METIGIRELKAHLSRHLKRVRAGTRLMVTDRGREVATISPADVQTRGADDAGVRQLIVAGKARWSGGKPSGARGLTVSDGPTLSSTVLDERR